MRVAYFKKSTYWLLKKFPFIVRYRIVDQCPHFLWFNKLRDFDVICNCLLHRTAAVAQWVRAFVLQAEGGGFESILVVKTVSHSLVHCLTLGSGVSVKGPRK